MGLNKHEHLKDSISGKSVGSINRALRALRAVQGILQQRDDPVLYSVESTSESYEAVVQRIQNGHNQRIKTIKGLLSEYITDGRIRIEDGGVKSQESAERKRVLLPNTPVDRQRDISRLRIVTQNLGTLIELNNSIAHTMNNKTSGLSILKQSSTYQQGRRGNMYPVVYLTLGNSDIIPFFHFAKSPDIGVDKAIQLADKAALQNFPTEIQIMTQRVREVIELNRNQYVAKKYHGAETDFSESNKRVLQAILLDWKEYFSKNPLS